jgi:hypothetical protein
MKAAFHALFAIAMLLGNLAHASHSFSAKRTLC